MDPRYQHSLITQLWKPTSIYSDWMRIERVAAEQQANMGIIPEWAAREITEFEEVTLINEKWARDIADIEKMTQHDVAAFLRWWREMLARNGQQEGARYLHFGLTSSDLVDTALGLRLADSGKAVSNACDYLVTIVDGLVWRYRDAPVLGLTHGQPAEPTSLGLRVRQWCDMLVRTASRAREATDLASLCKMSGPVGNFAHNPPELERRVATRLQLHPAGWGNSQVVPRDRLAAWAASLAGLVRVCAKIAVDFRLMAARGEAMEEWSQGRVGSSAMPHKRNPVTAEKICGMARLATGYAHMLEPVDLWDERDISHSSVERVAVPDLLHVTIHALESTTNLLLGAHFDTDRMLHNLDAAGRRPYSARRALELVQSGADRPVADARAREWANGDGSPQEDAYQPRWYWRNLPDEQA